MTPYEVAMLAARLCELDQNWRQNLPVATKTKVPEDFMEEAIELLEKAGDELKRWNEN